VNLGNYNFREGAVMDIKEWRSDAVTIKVDYDTCEGLGECVSSCPGEVYELIEKKTVATYIEQCIECCTCVEVCPVNAIEHSACDE